MFDADATCKDQCDRAAKERHLRRNDAGRSRDHDSGHDQERSHRMLATPRPPGERHHHQDAVMGCELREPVPRAAQHQQVALVQLHLRQAVAYPGLPAPHAHDHDVEGLEEVHFGDGLADERRVRRDDDLHQLRRVVEVPLGRLAVFLDRVECKARFAFDRDDFVRRRADKQDVALVQHRPAVLVVLRDAASQPFDDLEATVVVAVEIRDRLVDPARLRLDDDLGVVPVETQVVRLVRPRLALGKDPAAERHIDDGENDQCRADRRDTEDAERFLLARSKQVVHQEEGRCAEDGERRAERSRE